MSYTLLGSFADRGSAEAAINDLEEMGYNPKNLSVITKESSKEEVRAVGNDAADGAVAGAATGSVIGGLAGILAGAGVVPAIAGLLIGGPIAVALGATGIAATAISGAVTGAVAGGLVGGLTGLGVSEPVAKSYEQTINAGGLLVAVPVSEDQKQHARSILEAHGAHDITQIEK